MFVPVLRVTILCWWLMATSAVLWAQQPDSQRQVNANQAETIRIGTSLVTLNVGVFDGGGTKGRQVEGLTRERFTVYDNGKVQPIAFFGQADQPVSFGLLVDRSQSMGDSGKLANANAVLRAFLRAGNPQSEAFCLAFNQMSSLLEGFTSDYARIESALDSLTAEGGTSLYDAIGMGLEQLQYGKHTRRALLVITDGLDQHSAMPLALLLKKVQQSDAQIYMIGFFSSVEAELYQQSGTKITMMDGTEAENPRLIFQTLAKETGAETFFPRSAHELEKTVAEIAASLRRQYTLAFYPDDQGSSGDYHHLTVKLTGAESRNWQVKTRQGYRLAEPLNVLSAPDQPKTTSATASVTSVPPIVARSLPLGKQPAPPVYRQTFDSPAQGWPQTEKAFVQKGKYHLRSQQLVPVPLDEYSDFEASVSIFFPSRDEEVRRNSTDVVALAAAGLSFRINDRGYYEVALSPSRDRKGGYFQLLKVERGEKVELVRWRQDLAIQPLSELKVRCHGSQIEIFVNQLRVATVKDATHSQGRLGLTTGDNDAIFDDLLLKKIE